MKKNIFYLLLIGFTLILNDVNAQCDAPCTIWDCTNFQSPCYNEDEPAVPIDGGISLLIAGGAALGLGGLYKKRNKSNV